MQNELSKVSNTFQEKISCYTSFDYMESFYISYNQYQMEKLYLIINAMKTTIAIKLPMEMQPIFIL